MDNGDRLPGSDTGAKPRRSGAIVLENGRRFLEERAFVAVGKAHEAWRRRQTAPKPNTASGVPPSAQASAAPLCATEAAFKSIIEVRRPIRPEFSVGSLTQLVPIIVIAILVIMAISSPVLWLLLHQVTGAGPPPAYNPQAGFGSPY